jgi:hypothetical protein
MRSLVGSRLARSALAAAMFALADPSPAQAEWTFSAYLGGSKTASNTVRIEPETGDAFKIGPINYDTFAFESPVYYGWRLTYFLSSTPWLGVGIEFTHNKAVADVDQLVNIGGAPPAPLSDVLGRLELSNGLNFALANVVVRRPVAVGGLDDRLIAVAFGGLGAAIPHVETRFAGVETFEYQVTGLGWQAGGGIEWRIVGGLSAIADLRVTGGRQELDMTTGMLSGAFTSAQADFGVGWRFGRAPVAGRDAPGGP